ncbi:MAG: PAS domain-containing protein [Pseudomonadota bacterium]
MSVAVLLSAATAALVAAAPANAAAPLSQASLAALTWLSAVTLGAGAGAAWCWRRANQRIRGANQDQPALYEQVEALIGDAGTALWEWDATTGALWFSNYYNTLLASENASSATSLFGQKSRMHPEDADRVTASIEDRLTQDGAFEEEYRLLRDDNSYVWVRACARLTRDNTGAVRSVHGSFNDISSEVRLREKVRRQQCDIQLTQERNNLLKAVAVAANTSESFPDLARNVLRMICDSIDWSVGHAYLWNYDTARLEAADIWHFADDNRTKYKDLVHVTNAAPYSSGIGLPGRAETGDDSIWTDEAARTNNQERNGAFAATGVKAAFSFPVYVGPKVKCVLEFFNETATPEDENLFATLDAIAEQLCRVLERKENQTALRRSEERFAVAAAGASVGIFDWIDVRENTQWWSPILIELLGYEQDEITPGADMFQALLHPEDRQRTSDQLVCYFKDRSAFKIEHRLKHKKNGYRWFLTSGKAVWEEDGRAMRLIGSVMDIHDLRETQSALEKRTEWLERTNQDLDHFAYIASHDLRAPLRGMENLAEWIEEDLGDDAPEDVSKNLSLLRNRVNRMDKLLSDILAYSRAGKRDADPEPVDCQDLFREIVEWVNPKPGFTVTAETDLPTITITSTLLEQTLLNLISNAVKHHDRDEGKVTVSYHDHCDHHEFVITDDGPGIAQEFHERVFKMFQTLRRRDEVEGSGIGLAIVKKMVESAGGTVAIVSPITDRGTTFKVTFPKIEDASNTADDSASPDNETASQKEDSDEKSNASRHALAG